MSSNSAEFPERLCEKTGYGLCRDYSLCSAAWVSGEVRRRLGRWWEVVGPLKNGRVAGSWQVRVVEVGIRDSKGRCESWIVFLLGRMALLKCS